MSLTNFCAGLLLCSAVAAAAVLPAGAKLEVRLTTEVSSQQPLGETVAAVVISPVLVGSTIALSAGVTATGSVTEVTAFRPAQEDLAAQIAKLRIKFTHLQSEGGHTVPVAAVVEAVDNARETVDATGLINGIDPSQTYEAQLDKAVAKLQNRSSGLGSLLAGVQAAFLKQVDAAIDYKPGTEMTLKLTSPLTWNESSTTRHPAAIGPTGSLEALVNSLPSRTVAENPPEPSDLTNIMLIGTQQQVEAAFQSAGWVSAAALSGASKMETARALIENRGYSEAPMSILYLDGRPPDLALQRQNNTFAMRHHIRIWQTAQTFDGKPVWVAAATHDIKITFSAQSHNFTHGIDSHIDLERAKVVNDLIFTGMVRGISLVERSNLPKDLSNATGDVLLTDGKMAVLEF